MLLLLGFLVYVAFLSPRSDYGSMRQLRTDYIKDNRLPFSATGQSVLKSGSDLKEPKTDQGFSASIPLTPEAGCSLVVGALLLGVTNSTTTLMPPVITAKHVYKPCQMSALVENP